MKTIILIMLIIISTILYVQLSKKTVHLAPPVDPNPPSLTNLICATGNGTPNQTITWNESGTVTRRQVEFLQGTGTIDSISMGNLSLSSLSNTDYPPTPCSIKVTIFNDSYGTSSFGDLNISNPCFIGHVKLIKCDNSYVKSEDVKIGDELLQPNKINCSKVLEIKSSDITSKGNNFENDRLFADDSEKLVVTFWHKVKFEDEIEEQIAGNHPKLHEVQIPFPFKVYNFVLENWNHKILIADTNIITESFIPVNPA